MAIPSWLRPLLEGIEQGETFQITDTETTGSSAATCHVIELATVTVRGGQIVDRFSSLIDPGVHVPYWITGITGIDTEMLRGAPETAVVLDRWLSYLDSQGQFVAHNAPFDLAFLSEEFRRWQRPWPFVGSLCTVRLARHCLPHLPSRSLGALIAHYGIEVGSRHRALADAEATAHVFLALVDQLRTQHTTPHRG